MIIFIISVFLVIYHVMYKGMQVEENDGVGESEKMPIIMCVCMDIDSIGYFQVQNCMHCV